MKFRIACLLFLQMSVLVAWSQGTITGRVTKENGEALIGVTVAVKGAATATTTNNEGRYRITIPSGNASLLFSYVGSTGSANIMGCKNSCISKHFILPVYRAHIFIISQCIPCSTEVVHEGGAISRAARDLSD